MHETMEKVKEVCCMEEKFREALNAVLAHGIFSKEVDYKELGALSDMVKDMAETEKDLWKACYYKKMAEKLSEESMMPRYGDSYGYDHWRKASGEFAKKGTGTYYPGYMPNHVYDPNYAGHETLVGEDGKPMFGKEYNDYKRALKHYTDTNNQDYKTEMDEHATKHMDETIMSIKDIWKSADPNMRRKIRSTLSNLVAEMPV